MNFSNINANSFASDMLEKVVDRSYEIKRVHNQKKADWSSSWNPIKKIGSLFMDDFKSEIVLVGGYYETATVNDKISEYYVNLELKVKIWGTLLIVFWKIVSVKSEICLINLLWNSLNFLKMLKLRKSTLKRLVIRWRSLKRKFKEQRNTRMALRTQKEDRGGINNVYSF